MPAGDAVRRARMDVPLVVSVHGGDVLYTATRIPGGRAAVARGLGAARLVLANSQGIAELARAHGARETRWCTSAPTCPSARARARRPSPRSSPSGTSSRASATPT